LFAKDIQLTLQEAIAIAKRTIEGKASIDEKEALRTFIERYPDEGMFIEEMFPLTHWKEGPGRPLPAGMEHRLLENILGRRSVRRPGAIRQLTRIAVAAAILGVCVISGLVLLSKRHAGPAVALKMMTLSTQYGQVKSVVLEDGTHILLNGGTTLRFPENFTGGIREVFLDGEAFFDVSKDSLRPFVIRSPRVSTTVLGTSFSMRSASKEQVSAIAVATGKVRVEVGSSAAAIVTPGQEAVYLSGDGSGIQKKQVNIAGIGAWKDHWFYYEHTTLREILADLERAYGLHFRVADPTVLNYTYNATFKNISGWRTPLY
jgi:ferric-dicitrate binding protein FerR (iron transport regulator)